MCTNPIKIKVNNEEYTVKCGKCETCQREKYQEWAIKLINESKYHKKACFITLTFDNKIILDKNSKAHKYGADASFIFHIENSKEYFKKFIKRLRKLYKNTKISYYHVGEYGEKTKRCHHHAILYGIDFTEIGNRYEMEVSKSGHVQYGNEILTNLWACGRCSIEDINENNIIYISQYSLKKFKNNELNKRYKPIFSFSNRSKISTKWVRRNYNNIKKGYLETTDGKKFRIPKSYLNELKKSERKEHNEAYRKYEEGIMERLSNINSNELIKMQKNKEIIKKLQKQNYMSIRDF